MNNTITFKGIIWADDELDRDLPSKINVELTPEQVDAYNNCEVYSGPWSAAAEQIIERIMEIYQCDIITFDSIDWADSSELDLPVVEM